MANDLTNYLVRKIQFKLIDFKFEIAKDKLHGMKSSLIVLNKDNLTVEEYKQFIIEIEKNMKEKFSVDRMPILTNEHYVLKITSKEVLPDGV